MVFDYGAIFERAINDFYLGVGGGKGGASGGGANEARDARFPGGMGGEESGKDIASYVAGLEAISSAKRVPSPSISEELKTA